MSEMQENPDPCGEWTEPAERWTPPKRKASPQRRRRPGESRFARYPRRRRPPRENLTLFHPSMAPVWVLLACILAAALFIEWAQRQ